MKVLYVRGPFNVLLYTALVQKYFLGNLINQVRLYISIFLKCNLTYFVILNIKLLLVNHPLQGYIRRFFYINSDIC
jgi:hypothetical protein